MEKYRIIVICCGLLTATSVIPQDDSHTWSSLLQQCGHHIDNIGRTTGSAFLQTFQGIDTAVSQTPKSFIVGGGFIVAHYYIKAQYGGWSGLVRNQLPWPFSSFIKDDENRTPTMRDLYQQKDDLKKCLHDVVQQTQQQAYTDGYNQACEDIESRIRKITQEEFTRNVPHITSKIDYVYNSLRDLIYRIDAKLDNHQKQVKNDISYHGVETRSKIDEMQKNNNAQYQEINKNISNLKNRELRNIGEDIKDTRKRLFEKNGNLEQRMQNIEDHVSCILSSQDKRYSEMMFGLHQAINQQIDGGTAASSSYQERGNINVFFYQNVDLSSADNRLFQRYMPHRGNVSQPLYNSFPPIPQFQRSVQLSSYANNPHPPLFQSLQNFMGKKKGE